MPLLLFLLALLAFLSGSEAGNYYWVGSNLSTRLKGSVQVNVHQTSGSINNLDKLSDSSCDAAFVQNDALLVYTAKNPRLISQIERAGDLYKEYVHLLCNKEVKASRITELKADTTIAIGPLGSGSSVTWEGFVQADKKRYGTIPTSTLSGLRALNAVAEGNSVQCMIFTASPGSSFMVNDAQSRADKVKLVAADDRDFDNARDAKGKKLYTFQSINGRTYPKFLGGTFTYSDYSTVSVDAVFVVRQAWIDANERAFDTILRAKTAIQPEILKKVGQ